MASLIEGYEYDIFISYRQKDNKGDGWVSKFVEALKTEIDATFKEDISVYFDENPHDGLLETHDVDESLKEKLNCLVFIPIISRTYCDPQAFAWDHEFRVFVEQASLDKFGLKVKLPNGNVANRILPIRIHDLDNEDIKLCESILVGVLRGIEFIYKEPGVNRPLRSNEDKPQDNLNNTVYRNQINKVANSIREIIQGLKSEPVEPVKEKIQQRERLEKITTEGKKFGLVKTFTLSKRKLLSGIAIISMLVIVAILTYPLIFNRNKLNDIIDTYGKIPIVVMPFQNRTRDITLNDWQNGIQDKIITSLSNSEELNVKQYESINSILQSKNITNYVSITPTVASSISRKLDANAYIIGNIQQVGPLISINAQLINSKTGGILKSFSIDGLTDNIMHLSDSLSASVANYLLISILAQTESINLEHFASTSTNSREAFMNYMYGRKAFNKGDLPTARDWLLKAIAIDSSFYEAARLLSYAYSNAGLYEEGKKWCLRVYAKRDQMSIQQNFYINYMYSLYFGTPSERITYLEQYLKINDQSPGFYSELGWIYLDSFQYDRAIPAFEKAQEILEKWGSKQNRAAEYTGLGKAYHKTGQYKKERRLYKIAENDFPNDPSIVGRQAILSLTEGKKKEANEYIYKFVSLGEEALWSEVRIANALGNIYSEAYILDKAEEYYRQALLIEPENADNLNTLAYFLIVMDRNNNEGLELIDKALKINPDFYSYLHTKGWGLFKQGKYKEASKILQKSWDLRLENAIYNHEAYLHLDEANRAAGQI